MTFIMICLLLLKVTGLWDKFDLKSRLKGNKA